MCHRGGRGAIDCAPTWVFLVVALLFVSACNRVPEGPPAEGPVVISIWHQKDGGERVFFERQIAAYNAQQDSIRVEILYRETEELRNLFVIASVGGQGPDLIFGPSDNMSILAMTGSIRPITDVLETDYLTRFDSTGVLGWEGQQWLVADQVGNHLAFVYNRALLPEVPETWAELIPILQRLTVDENGDGRPERYGLAWNYTEPFFFIPFMTGFGGWMMDAGGNPTLDTPQMVAAIEFVLALRDEYRVIPRESDYNVAETLFKEGRAAAIINGPWAWAGYGAAGIDYGIARIPRIAATGEWAAPVVSSKGYSVNVNVPDWKLPYVAALLEHLTGPEMQRQMATELATIPVLPDVRDLPAVQNNELLTASIRQVAVGQPMPLAPQLRQVWDGMRGPYQLVMNGAVGPEEGAALMQREVQKRIDDTFL